MEVIWIALEKIFRQYTNLIQSIQVIQRIVSLLKIEANYKCYKILSNLSGGDNKFNYTEISGIIMNLKLKFWPR